MAQINIKQLETFVHVADLGSFRRAAEKLNTTQPNISARIAALEAQLGLKLMDRDAGSVRLTPIGTTLLLKARAVLRAVDALILAADDDHLFEGVLRLGVTEMIVHSWLSDFLTALKDRFPSVHVDLTVDLSANLSTSLFNRGLDLVLQSGPFNRQTTGMTTLGNFEMIWVGAPGLGLGADAVELADLAVHPILTHARGTLPFEQLKSHLAAWPDVPVRVFPSTNMAACLQMTRDGLGIACLPEVMVRSEIASGGLVALKYKWVPDALWFAGRYDADTAPHYVTQAADLARAISMEYAGEANT